MSSTRLHLLEYLVPSSSSLTLSCCTGLFGSGSCPCPCDQRHLARCIRRARLERFPRQLPKRRLTSPVMSPEDMGNPSLTDSHVTPHLPDDCLVAGTRATGPGWHPIPNLDAIPILCQNLAENNGTPQNNTCCKHLTSVE